jgi:hypothetical protein
MQPSNIPVKVIQIGVDAAKTTHITWNLGEK